MSKPTCLIGGMFNYDTITWKENRKAPEQVMAHEVGGTGGVVSKLLAVLGWHALPIGRFDDTEEGRLLKSGLADFGCDTRFVTNTPDGGTTLLTVCTTKVEGGPNKKAIRTSNAKDKAAGVKSRFPRWKYIKIDQARELAAGLDFVPDVFFFDTAAAGHRELARILREKGTLVYFEPCNPKDPACMKSVELADVVKFSNEDFPDVSFVERYPDKLFIQTLGGPDGARFRFPGHDWQAVPGFVNDNVINPEGSGDWTTMGFLTTLWRSGGVRFASLTPERVAAALSTGQWYASRNCSYITTCSDELLDELGVRGIVERPMRSLAEECRATK